MTAEEMEQRILKLEAALAGVGRAIRDDLYLGDGISRIEVRSNFEHIAKAIESALCLPSPPQAYQAFILSSNPRKREY
jgi:hypothetical protein